MKSEKLQWHPGFYAAVKAEGRNVDGRKAEDITIILVCSRRPFKLLKYLKYYCKMKIIIRQPGIYEIVDHVLFRTFIVVAHPKLAKRMKEDDEMRAIQTLFAPELAEAKRLAAKEAAEKATREATENKAHCVAHNMFLRGFSMEDTAGIIEVDMDTVKVWYSEWSEQTA